MVEKQREKYKTLQKLQIIRRVIIILFQIVQTEAVIWRCSVKKVFLKTSQNSQENTCIGVFFLIKLQPGSLKLYQKRGPGNYMCIYVNFAKFIRTPIFCNFGELKLEKTFSSNLEGLKSQNSPQGGNHGRASNSL